MFCIDREDRGDESDYYTPEEPNPSNSVPLYEENAAPCSTDGTPQRLPGTPSSHASTRSSGDSYSSGTSTRHLLAVTGLTGLNERPI